MMISQLVYHTDAFLIYTKPESVNHRNTALQIFDHILLSVFALYTNPVVVQATCPAAVCLLLSLSLCVCVLCFCTQRAGCKGLPAVGDELCYHESLSHSRDWCPLMKCSGCVLLRCVVQCSRSR